MPMMTRDYVRKQRKQLILDFCRGSGKTVEKAAKNFNVPYATMNRWMLELEREGELLRSPIPGENGKKIYVTATSDSKIPQIYIETPEGPKPISRFLENYLTQIPSPTALCRETAKIVAHLYIYALRKENENVEISPPPSVAKERLRYMYPYLKMHLYLIDNLLVTNVFYHGDQRTLSAFGVLADQLTLEDILDLATEWEHEQLSGKENLDSNEEED